VRHRLDQAGAARSLETFQRSCRTDAKTNPKFPDQMVIAQPRNTEAIGVYDVWLSFSLPRMCPRIATQ
jgi:hypothetical protein